MKLKFDSGLEYQLEAIKSVTDLFEGLPQEQGGLSIKLNTELLDTGMDENKEAGEKGGGIAKKARRELEAKTGRKVVTGESFLPPSSKKELPKSKNI